MILNTQINIKHFYRFIEYTSKMLKKIKLMKDIN